MMTQAAVIDTAEEERFFVLNERREPVPATKAEWSAVPRTEFVVAETELEGGVKVTTSFLGIDLFYGEEDPPLVFGSLVTYSPDTVDEDIFYRSWDEAERGHQELVRRIQNGGSAYSVQRDEPNGD